MRHLLAAATQHCCNCSLLLLCVEEAGWESAEDEEEAEEGSGGERKKRKKDRQRDKKDKKEKKRDKKEKKEKKKRKDKGDEEGGASEEEQGEARQRAVCMAVCEPALGIMPD